MKVKRHMIPVIVILLLVVLLVAAYQLFRFPTLFRHLSDQSLPKEQVEILKNDIAAKDAKKVLVAYFSYSGTTQRVANELSAEIGADLFEITPQTPYPNVYLGSNMELRHGEHPPLSIQSQTWSSMMWCLLGIRYGFTLPPRRSTPFWKATT